MEQYSDEGVIFSEPELRKLCKYWQKIMKLQDWDIRVHIERMADMPEGTQGFMSGDIHARAVTILVLHPEDYRNKIRPQDMEQTLIHELAHIHMIPFHAEEDELDNEEEVLVNAWADSLLAVKRAS